MTKELKNYYSGEVKTIKQIKAEFDSFVKIPQVVQSGEMNWKVISNSKEYRFAVERYNEDGWNKLELK